MKKLIFLFVFLGSSFLMAQERPFQAFFGIKTSNPLAVVSAMDDLAAANCPGTSSARLMNELFNGGEDTTHTIIITYPDKMSYMMWANNFTSCPAAGKFLQTMSEISEQTFQFMGMPLLTEGDPNGDQFFQVFLMDVSDPSTYASEYAKLMATGQCPSSYSLVAMGPGADIEEYGTHFAYCGFKNMDSFLDSYMGNSTPTDAYMEFASKVADARTLKAINMSAVVKDWLPSQ